MLSRVKVLENYAEENGHLGLEGRIFFRTPELPYLYVSEHVRVR